MKVAKQIRALANVARRRAAEMALFDSNAALSSAYERLGCDVWGLAESDDPAAPLARQLIARMGFAGLRLQAKMKARREWAEAETLRRRLLVR